MRRDHTPGAFPSDTRGGPVQGRRPGRSIDRVRHAGGEQTFMDALSIDLSRSPRFRGDVTDMMLPQPLLRRSLPIAAGTATAHDADVAVAFDAPVPRATGGAIR